MSGEFKEKIIKTKNLIELMVRGALGTPKNFYVLDKDIKSRLYSLNGKVIEAIPVGEVRELELALTDEETNFEIREAMTKARLSEIGFNANAFYIRKKNGTMMYGDGGDVTQYQPLLIRQKD